MRGTQKQGLTRDLRRALNFSPRQRALAGLAVVPFAACLAKADIVVWNNGQANGLWDSTSTNWNDVTTSNSSATYADGDAVQFSDSGPGGAITVNQVTAAPAGVSPASVEFTHGTGANGNYTLTNGTATSGIEGPASVTLDAGYTGEVILSSANSYTGGTFINGGTLHAGNGALPSTCTVTIAGGTFQGTSSATYSATQSFVVGAGSNSTFSATGNTPINGSISSGAGAIPAGTILNLTGAFTVSTSALNNFTGTFEMGSMGSGTVRLDFGTATAPAGGSANAIFDLGNSTATLQSYNGGGSGTGAFTNAIPLGALEGSGTGSILSGSGHTGSTVYAIGALGLSTTYAGKITNSSHGPTSLEIVGGALTLTGNNSYSNVSGQVGTTIMGGAVYADNAISSTGTGGVLVAGKTAQGFGTLGGNGTVTNGTSVNSPSAGVASFAQGGHLAPGAAGTSGPTGTLTLTGGLTLNDYTNLDLTLNGASTSSGDDLISTNNGNLTLSGNSLVRVNFQLVNGEPAPGSTYDLINYGTGTLSYIAGGSNANVSGWSATGVPADETATFSTPGNGQVDVTFNAIPEPATIGLLAISAVGLLSRRRRA